MSRSYVFQHSVLRFKIKVTIFAGKLPTMNQHMPFQSSSRLHVNVADLTTVRFLSGVCPFVSSKITRCIRFIFTETAGIRFLSGVCPFVNSKITRSNRFIITQTARIRFLCGVCPFVNCKIARSTRFIITQIA